MDYRVCCYAVLWGGLFAGVRNECAPERPGRCNTDNNAYDNDTEVHPACTLNCDFNNSLCSYRQGCLDVNTTAWTAVDGHAQADHTGGGCGAASFSALESGWVNVTTASCVEFGFSSPLPYRLDCFLLQRDGPVITMLNRSRYQSQEHLSYTVNFTLPPVVGKLQFRLFGGGGFTGEPRKLLQLQPVSLHEGRCETPELAFSESPPALCCGWQQVNWNTTPDSNDSRVALHVNATDDVATLTSALTRPSDQQRVDCLRFRYRLNNSDSSLNVSIKLTDGLSVTTWSTTGQGTGSWRNATVPITTTSPYQVVFESLKSGGDEVVLAEVKVTPSDPPCDVDPPEAGTGRVLPTDLPSASPCPTTPQTDTTSPRTGESTGGSVSAAVTPTTPAATTHLSSAPAPASLPSGDDDQSTAIISGTAIAVTVVFVIFIVLVLRRIAKAHRRHVKEDARHGASCYTSPCSPDHGGLGSSSYGYSRFRSPQPGPSSQTPLADNDVTMSEVTSQEDGAISYGDKTGRHNACCAVTETPAQSGGGGSGSGGDVEVDVHADDASVRGTGEGTPEVVTEPTRLEDVGHVINTRL